MVQIEEHFKVDGEQTILIDIIENYQEKQSEEMRLLQEEIAAIRKERSGSQGSGSSGSWVVEEEPPLDLTKFNLPSSSDDDSSSPRFKPPSEPEYLNFLSNHFEQMDIQAAVDDIR